MSGYLGISGSPRKFAEVRAKACGSSSIAYREIDNFRKGFTEVCGCMRKSWLLLAHTRKSSLVADDIPLGCLSVCKPA
jgi:hypothetical protein